VADNTGRFAPGTGEFNHPGVAQAHRDMGYHVPVGMEAFASVNPKVSLAAMHAAPAL
jgi:hydroxypyruvate isomerase